MVISASTLLAIAGNYAPGTLPEAEKKQITNQIASLFQTTNNFRATCENIFLGDNQDRGGWNMLFANILLDEAIKNQSHPNAIEAMQIAFQHGALLRNECVISYLTHARNVATDAGIRAKYDVILSYMSGTVEKSVALQAINDLLTSASLTKADKNFMIQLKSGVLKAQTSTMMNVENLTLTDAFKTGNFLLVNQTIDRLSRQKGVLIDLTKDELKSYCFLASNYYRQGQDASFQARSQAYITLARKLNGENVSSEELNKSLTVLKNTNQEPEKSIVAKLEDGTKSFWDKEFLGLSAKAWAWIIGGLIVGGLCYGAFRKGGWLNKKSSSKGTSSVSNNGVATTPTVLPTVSGQEGNTGGNGTLNQTANVITSGGLTTTTSNFFNELLNNAKQK